MRAARRAEIPAAGEPLGGEVSQGASALGGVEPGAPIDVRLRRGEPGVGVCGLGERPDHVPPVLAVAGLVRTRRQLANVAELPAIH